MTIQKNPGKSGSGPILTADDVAQYLYQHPDFFHKQPSVLAELEIPHQSGDAISLIERQVGVLRADNKQLRQRIRELVDIARENDTLMAKLHRISVVLVESGSVDNFIDSLSERLEQDFSADCVSIRLFDSFTDHAVSIRPEIINRDDDGADLFASILNRKKPVCGKFNDAQLSFLFGQSAEKVGSAAVVPLFDMEATGMIAIASTDPERFRAGMSTVFLAYLGEIASSVLKGLR